MKDWFQKEIDESGSNDWMLAFGKKCPGCGKIVDKSFGCNHMNPPYHPDNNCCKYEWCWLCGGKWSEHGGKTGGWYACNIHEK